MESQTLPSGATIIQTNHHDGAVYSIGGTGAHPVRYLYGADTDGPYVTEIKLAAGGGTNEWVKTSQDKAGRTYKTVYAKSSAPYPTSLMNYNSKGQLTSSVDPDNVITLPDSCVAWISVVGFLCRLDKWLSTRELFRIFSRKAALQAVFGSKFWL